MGEIIYLHKIIRSRKTLHKKKGTETCLASFVATEEFIITEPYQPGRPSNSALTYPMEYLRCPTCASVGNIVIDLEEGPCPR
ncbi:MAG: hypothetical protein HYZ45_10500 [Burkholderiales bacterium]|nr:hypothetical protein [Burkholderiales bacterium]